MSSTPRCPDSQIILYCLTLTSSQLSEAPHFNLSPTPQLPQALWTSWSIISKVPSILCFSLNAHLTFLLQPNAGFLPRTQLLLQPLSFLSSIPHDPGSEAALGGLPWSSMLPGDHCSTFLSKMPMVSEPQLISLSPTLSSYYFGGFKHLWRWPNIQTSQLLDNLLSNTLCSTLSETPRPYNLPITNDYSPFSMPLSSPHSRITRAVL